MKILLCHNFYRQIGGEDVAVLALKSLLEQKGHRVILYSKNNHEIDNYGLLAKTCFFPRALLSPQTLRDIRGILAQENPDIAHVHNVFPLLSPAVYVALKQSGIPIVQTIHNYRFMCINGLLLRNGSICERCKYGNFFSGVRFKCYRDSYPLSALYALAIGTHRRLGTFRRIDRFIALTRFAADKLIESGVANAAKISVLGHFLPPPLPDCGKREHHKPYILYIGRLSQEKGLFTLLEAMRDLKHIGLKIMGEGPLAPEIRSYVQRHACYHIEMLGFIDGERKYRLLRNAFCAVMPSECYEVFGFPVLESAAVGTPIVASRIGSLAMLVKEGHTGLLFAPGNSGDLREKLQFLLDRPETAVQMGQQARHWLETEYSAEAHYKGLMQIYHQVLQ